MWAASCHGLQFGAEQKRESLELGAWLSSSSACQANRTGVWIPKTMSILGGCGDPPVIPASKGKDRGSPEEAT